MKPKIGKSKLPINDNDVELHKRRSSSYDKKSSYIFDKDFEDIYDKDKSILHERKSDPHIQRYNIETTKITIMPKIK